MFENENESESESESEDVWCGMKMNEECWCNVYDVWWMFFEGIFYEKFLYEVMKDEWRKKVVWWK